MNGNPLSLEEAAAHFVVDFESDHIDERALTSAKSLFKDQLAIQIGASQLPWSRQVRQSRRLKVGNATIVGEATTADATDAAYLNATYGHGFEYDDFAGNAHPGCCVVPTALAVGDEVGATLGQALLAMVVGYEIYVRIGYLGSPDLLNAGWQPHSVLANFGAAAVAAKLYRVDESTAFHALAIALSHASGTTEYASTGGSIKRAHAGFSVRNGIESVDLARQGVTGPLRFLTGDRGLYRTFIRKVVGDNEASIFALDQPLKISELSFKPYCSCAATHPYIDAMTTLQRSAADIDSVVANIQTMADAIVGNRNANIYKPHNIEEVQYSLPVQMALAALGAGNGYRTHRTLLQGNPPVAPESEVIQLARKISLHVSETLDREYPRGFVADVTVTYRDGSTEHLFRKAAKGTPGNPMTLEEHGAKLDDLTRDVVGKDRADELWSVIDGMDYDAPVSSVTSLLRF